MGFLTWDELQTVINKKFEFPRIDGLGYFHILCFYWAIIHRCKPTDIRTNSKRLRGKLLDSEGLTKDNEYV